jgi:SAM-dependent methyltransferase
MTQANSAVQTYWDSKPCGSLEPTAGKAPAEFFEAHAELRYAREPEIVAFAGFDKWRGQRVLEIGVGMGADFVRFAKAQAKICGVDLSRRSLGLALENAEIHHVSPTLLNADCESLPFPDESFDMIYSWGVLHHTSNIDRALLEVHRVLKPQGECRLMLYHRWSLVGLQCYLRYGLCKLRPFTPLSRLIGAHVESPGTKAYTLGEVESLLGKFRTVEVEPVITVYDVRLGRRRFAPHWMLRLIPDRLGWFLLICAKK